MHGMCLTVRQFLKAFNRCEVITCASDGCASRRSACWWVIVQVFDQYIIKYFASVVALLVYAAPVYLKDAHRSMEESTQDYIRAMRLLQNTSKCALRAQPDCFLLC